VSNRKHGSDDHSDRNGRALAFAALALVTNGCGGSLAAVTLAPNNPFAGARAFSLGELRANAVRVEVHGQPMVIGFDADMRTELQATIWNRLHDCYPQFAFAMGSESNDAAPIDVVVNAMEPITSHSRGSTWRGVTVEVDVTVGTAPRQDRLRIRYDLRAHLAAQRATHVAMAWPIADAIGRHLVQRTGVGAADVRTPACPAP
jgi:hypothetical protein